MNNHTDHIMIGSITVIMMFPLTKTIDVTVVTLHLYKDVTDGRTIIASTTYENSHGIDGSQV
jgi:hypothetical protein